MRFVVGLLQELEWVVELGLLELLLLELVLLGLE